MWRSLVARFLGVEEAAGSNPVIPIQKLKRKGSQLNQLRAFPAFSPQRIASVRYEFRLAQRCYQLRLIGTRKAV